VIRADAHDLKILAQEFCPEVTVELAGTEADTDDFFHAILLERYGSTRIITLCLRSRIPEYPVAT
jgi:hypothetical protein